MLGQAQIVCVAIECCGNCPLIDLIDDLHFKNCDFHRLKYQEVSQKSELQFVDHLPSASLCYKRLCALEICYVLP